MNISDARASHRSPVLHRVLPLQARAAIARAQLVTIHFVSVVSLRRLRIVGNHSGRWIRWNLAAIVLGSIFASSLQAEDALEMNRRYEGSIPIGAFFMHNAQDMGTRIQESIDSVWQDPKREPTDTAVARAVQMANDLWMESSAVVTAAKAEGVSGDYLAGGQSALKSLEHRWEVQDMDQLMLSEGIPSYPDPRMRGWIAEFRRNNLRWVVWAWEGEPDGHPTCIATLSRDNKFVFEYRPDDYGEMSQTLYLTHGWLSFGEDTDSESGGNKFTASLVKLSEEHAPSTAQTPLANASSNLDGNHAAQMALDGMTSTAWCEGTPGDGINESYQLTWPSAVRIGAIAVFPGFGKSRGIFYANNRIKRLKLTYSNGAQFEVDVADRPSLQYVPLFDGDTAEIGTTPTTSLKVEVLSVYPGSKYHDTCIAEIRTKLE